ncbi:MAG: hypothetical protein SFU56_10070 [Capsulimonadales bacterium]|nr:hypothetical protein [Capsulimonadales bacterium]
MGYVVFLLKGKATIEKSRQAAAFEAIKKLVVTRGEDTFPFLNSAEFRSSTDLVAALKAVRWEPELDDEENIVSLFFTGEKLGDESSIFESIAPFVAPGSEIRMAGEDGQIWRWVFEHGMVKRQPGIISFVGE